MSSDTFFTPEGSARHIVFASSMENGRWGGSEELWSRTAANLAKRGVSVAASVQYWPNPHERVLNLIKDGVDVGFRRKYQPWRERLWRKVTRRRAYGASKQELERFIECRHPDLVVLSSGAALPPLAWVELCVDRNWRFVTIGQNNYVDWWPVDEEAERYRRTLELAQRCFFVADANRRLLQVQLGCELLNAEVVRNPFNVDPNVSHPWPQLEALRFACVGRLYPPQKGQHILLEALAGAPWVERNWFLTVFGEGPMRETLERFRDKLCLAHRVSFAGFVDNVQEIWARNHVLVAPSRFEGLPLAMVEAMLCGRPVIATDVAGHSEVVEDGITGFLADAATVDAFRDALESAWQRRADLPRMGELAARRVRKLIPADPIEAFSQKILTTAEGNCRHSCEDLRTLPR